MTIQIGDIVAIKTYKNVDLWNVIDIYQHDVEIAKLKGLTNRSIARIPVHFLFVVDQHEWAFVQFLQEKRSSMDEIDDKTFYKNPGKVLHLDGSEDFMKKCTEKYKELGIPGNSYFITPSEMSKKVVELLEKHQPDILIITGHDGYNSSKDMYSLDSYDNSKDYVETVKEARKYDHNKNNLIIFAGACQSFFEALIAAGANFASSPNRISIDTYDPVFIADKIAYTPLLQKVDLVKTILSTKLGMGSIGGIDSEGCLRNSIPSINASSKYVSTSRLSYPYPMIYSHFPYKPHFF